MSVYVIDTIKQKNNGTFPVVEAVDVKYDTNVNVKSKIDSKQDLLVSGTNIKTINNQSILGSGNIVIQGGSGSSNYDELSNRPQINGVTLTGNKLASNLNLIEKSYIGETITQELFNDETNKIGLKAYESEGNSLSKIELSEDVINLISLDDTSEMEFLLTPSSFSLNYSLADSEPSAGISISNLGSLSLTGNSILFNGVDASTLVPVSANPNLGGDEPELEGIKINNVDYKIPTADLSDYSTTQEMNQAISTAVGVVDDKLDEDVELKTSASNDFTYSGDVVTYTRSYKNLNDGTTSTKSETIQLANSSTAGMMSPADVLALSNHASRISALEGSAPVKLLYTTKANPTEIEIMDFVLNEGYESPFTGVSVTVDETKHVWRFYANTMLWNDDGVETTSIFTNTTPGIIKGSAVAGKVYAENDGTGSVYGWDTLNGKVGNVETGLAGKQPTINSSNRVLSDYIDDTNQTHKFMTAAEKTKLSTVEEYANYYVLPSNVVQDSSYVHTDNNYTTAEKTSLALLGSKTIAERTSQLVNDGEDGLSPYATEQYVADYVEEHGGSGSGAIDSISVNGVTQQIVNKNVDLHAPRLVKLI